MTIYVGDYVVLVVETSQNMDDAESTYLRVMPPGGTAENWSASASGTILTCSASFDTAGTYIVHAYVEYEGGTSKRGNAFKIDVLPEFRI